MAKAWVPLGQKLSSINDILFNPFLISLNNDLENTKHLWTISQMARSPKNFHIHPCVNKKTKKREKVKGRLKVQNLLFLTFLHTFPMDLHYFATDVYTVSTPKEGMDYYIVWAPISICKVCTFIIWDLFGNNLRYIMVGMHFLFFPPISYVGNRTDDLLFKWMSYNYALILFFSYLKLLCSLWFFSPIILELSLLAHIVRNLEPSQQDQLIMASFTCQEINVGKLFSEKFSELK